MESVLTAIAKQANLDRVLFTPSLKKIYFDMAVASGGATQFKHAESVRSGLSYAADKAGDNKQSLLFCAAHELVHAYDSLLQISANLLPVVVLALREGTPDHQYEHASFLQLRDIGWAQFLTHTPQEAYDHLALTYHLFAEKELKLPVIVFHSALTHGGKGEFAAREEMNLGNPLTGLQSARADKKLDFEAALAAVRSKKEKPTLRGTYERLVPELRGIYAGMGYALPEKGLPCAGTSRGQDECIVSLLPPADEKAAAGVVRPLCYRPWVNESLAAELHGKKRVAVVEPRPGPGTGIPPFFGEVCGMLGPSFAGRVVSVTAAPGTAVLSARQADDVRGFLRETKADARFFTLS